MFQTAVVQKIKTHILCEIAVFRKSYRLWNTVGRCCRARQTTHDNVMHAPCVLDI